MHSDNTDAPLVAVREAVITGVLQCYTSSTVQHTFSRGHFWQVSGRGNKNFRLYSLREVAESGNAAYFYRVDTLWEKTESIWE